MNLPNLPALRLGKPYESLEQIEVRDHRTGAPMALMSQVNAGIIRKDLARASEARAALKKFSVAQLIDISAKAGDIFINGELPLGTRGHLQTPQAYVATLSRTSGLPHVMVRRNMQKIYHALTNLEMILRGLTRGMPLEVIDRGFGEHNGATVSYYSVTNALGLVMPSNSPAVNSLWLPAIALKTPVFIKPGREEPWTPFRLVQAFLAAGAPAEAFGFYPTDHEGSGEVMRLCGRALIFGDVNTVAQYRDNPKFSVHGPGFSKILIGEDEIENWRNYIDLMVASVSENGGRSCVNASAIVVPRYAREIAEELARQLGPSEPLAPENEEARLSGFANPKMAELIHAAIEADLKVPGAADITAKYRGGPRKVERDGGVYLRPTIVLCDSFEHPLANREFLCPYASVVQIPQDEVLGQIGPSLVVTAITRDTLWMQELLDSSLIERLNLGPVSTTKISWDQPHEGNLFEFLYKRRSIDWAGQPAVAAA